MANADENAARKDRIISHMNRDHTREMSHYLRHYNGLSARQAARPSLRDLSLEALLIRADGLDHTLPFAPPLASWAEVRPRLVEMDAVARAALDISDVAVTSYVAPRPADWAVLLAVSFYFVSAATLPWTGEGSAAWRLLEAARFPGGAATFRWLVRALFVPVLGIHVAECYLLDRWRLSRHGVERFSAVWLMWEVSCFLEGLMAWHRFDELVAEKQRQKAAKKH
ncbi:hypothetical protein ISF_08141 [Cordyceps fumosorosea ARSEF 2679]|uniref:DUF2470 domain-containing protein n=1 Tax=Cordyceps fumosorosea (strain ARSEF 2679) TaxID=1081104 RepID=A0A162MDZ6_CORFA|nr:hypothetical protein ISF_08141 [Cordyceps fumosorosea ARSEF 2679]OAA54870.1 hypothetical protein ISF_08141 [Cordyceps fumosorosea ARSEF 2679]